jgi:hypothetical protein
MRTYGRIPNPAFPAKIPPPWSPIIAYATGQQVLASDGFVYTAAAPSTGSNPAGNAFPALWTITPAKLWVEVQTDANGFDDWVWFTTLCQVLKLNLGESPFYAQYGLPAKQSIVQQVFPDFYVARTQQQFAQYFASVSITKQPSATPTYTVNVTTNRGVAMSATVVIPT